MLSKIPLNLEKDYNTITQFWELRFESAVETIRIKNINLIWFSEMQFKNTANKKRFTYLSQF